VADRTGLSPDSASSRRATRRALDEAIVAFRRGDVVLLDGENGAVLAVAAELVTDENLDRLRNMSSRRLSVVLTRRRAVALGLAPRSALAGAVRVTVAAQLSAAVIRNLADPAASLGAEPPGYSCETCRSAARRTRAVARSG
jgi:hypothetical protein